MGGSLFPPLNLESFEDFRDLNETWATSFLIPITTRNTARILRALTDLIDTMMKSIGLSPFFATFGQVVLGQEATPSASSTAPSLVETGPGSTVATHVVTVGKVGVLGRKAIMRSGKADTKLRCRNLINSCLTHLLPTKETSFVSLRIIASKHGANSSCIEFQFFPPNHSVGRAEYQQPCIPYEDTGENKVGFWSGFYPLSKILDYVGITLPSNLWPPH